MIRMIDGVKDLRLDRIEMRKAETKNTLLKNVIFLKSATDRIHKYMAANELVFYPKANLP